LRRLRALVAIAAQPRGPQSWHLQRILEYVDCPANSGRTSADKTSEDEWRSQISYMTDLLRVQPQANQQTQRGPARQVSLGQRRKSPLTNPGSALVSRLARLRGWGTCGVKRHGDLAAYPSLFSPRNVLLKRRARAQPAPPPKEGREDLLKGRSYFGDVPRHLRGGYAMGSPRASHDWLDKARRDNSTLAEIRVNFDVENVDGSRTLLCSKAPAVLYIA
jgi:hypothetical protein